MHIRFLETHVHPPTRRSRLTGYYEKWVSDNQGSSQLSISQLISYNVGVVFVLVLWY
jgi:hypothetical protein